MTDHLKQSISALLDEEISEIEVHRLLREFDSDPELKTSWVRYQQIRAVSQGHHRLSETRHLELHQSISAAIDAEGEHAWSGGKTSSWQKTSAGFAIAASLVVAVMMGVNLNQPTDSMDGGFVAGQSNDNLVTENPIPSQVVEPQLVAFNEDDLELRELDEVKQQRLREYLMRHDRMSQMNQMNDKTQTVNFPARAGQN